ncbi:hypothetical protein [Mesoterricola silvestris]|uniref:Uncharacterized protein n=1 Tax=Mesoterricola silvestris TaxID=2927979 RepID=A0AA48K954_9BACT|nr:hypothetical protein [Mesoterricola silvestris]BDU73654.1 hypothetical protein METEAL_28280 [Mesoterricola silvestris]
MRICKLCFRLAAPLFCLALAGGETLTLKVLPLDSRGIAAGLKPTDWKVQIAGKGADVVAMRTPEELGKEGQKWTFLLLPVRDPDFRQVVLQSLATFMASLPPSDSALVVMRTSKGLECLTPGFTTRPSLWAKALTQAAGAWRGKLEGNPNPVFNLPPTPASEPQEGMEAVNALLAGGLGRAMARDAKDTSSTRRSVIGEYSPEELGGVTKTVTAAMEEVMGMARTLAKAAPEAQVVIISRNEIDDLTNPIWAQRVSRMSAGGLKAPGLNEIMGGRDVMNNRLQTELMVRDVTLARVALKNTFAGSGITLHSVGGVGESNTGPFGEAAVASGGNTFRLENELPARLTQALNLWATRYELKVPVPAGTPRPAAVKVEAGRKDLKLFAPTLQ